MTPPTEVMASPAAIGERLAQEILMGVREAGARGRDYVLGCPAGRTPLPIYSSMAELAGGLDLARLRLVLMDEFVEAGPGGWRAVPTEAPHSCRGFAERELLAGLPGLPRANLHVPDPQAPEAYEALIEALGGIDLFLLAAGASDGHVAFNPPGTLLDSRTRIVRLAEATRRDNLATFPALGSLEAVPTHGVSVGLGTIAFHARAAVMVLHGAHKAPAFDRLARSAEFDPDWPASVIFACRRPRLVIDAELAAALPEAGCQNT